MAARLAKLTAVFWNRSLALDSTVREYSNRKWHKTNQSREQPLC
jgi:hypothetical protein